MNRYLTLSRTPWYSLVMVLPLAAIYEGLAWLVNWQSEVQLRNGADVLLRMLLRQFGLAAPRAVGVLLAIGLLAVWLWQRYRHGDEPLQPSILAGMLAESALWAGVLLVALLAADSLLLSLAMGANASGTVLPTALLSIGAGLYEEAVFRLGLVTALLLLFRRVLLWHTIPATVMAVVGAAVLFGLFHYVGPTAEPFGWNSFAYRSVAGVLLGALFIVRGFGITAYAHSGYDLVVLGLLTVHS